MRPLEAFVGLAAIGALASRSPGFSAHVNIGVFPPYHQHVVMRPPFMWPAPVFYQPHYYAPVNNPGLHVNIGLGGGGYGGARPSHVFGALAAVFLGGALLRQVFGGGNGPQQERQQEWRPMDRPVSSRMALSRMSAEIGSATAAAGSTEPPASVAEQPTSVSMTSLDSATSAMMSTDTPETRTEMAQTFPVRPAPPDSGTSLS
jgi:hypothetical protein